MTSLHQFILRLHALIKLPRCIILSSKVEEIKSDYVIACIIGLVLLLFTCFPRVLVLRRGVDSVVLFSFVQNLFDIDDALIICILLILEIICCIEIVLEILL